MLDKQKSNKKQRTDRETNYLVGWKMRPSILNALSAEVEVAGKALWAFQNIDRS